MGLPLSAEQSGLLQARTEGWITGLHLAALSLLNHDDPAGFITAFSGSHRYVVEYLLEEVLSRQSEAIQDFLLQTCVLERLSAPLCDAVRAQGGSQALLDFLEQTNLFIIPSTTNGSGIAITTSLLRPCSRRPPYCSRNYTVAPAVGTSSRGSTPRRSPMRWRLLLSRRPSA